MSMLAPKLSILDETDSGLDIDALKIVSDGVNTLRNKDNSFLIITHYQRLLDYIKPDFVHVLMNGRIIKSDIENYKEPLSQTKAQPTMSTSDIQEYSEVNHSQMRKLIAKRLSESKFSAPHYYLEKNVVRMYQDEILETFKV